MKTDLEQDLIPPADLVADGSDSLASYLSVGEHFKRIFDEHLQLRPDLQVLELGSCIGRISRQFVNILSEQGGFTGIDIMPKQVEWCNANISSRFPWMRFLAADIYNAEYNPQGSLKASSYRFPFADGQLDMVILTSVFTHMLRQDVAHYLQEIGRVLKPGGRCFATFFLYSRQELPRIVTQDARPPFYYPIYQAKGLPVVVSAHSESLEAAVAYEEEFVRGIYEKSGLAIEKQLAGDWLKRETPTCSYQDIIISRKPL